LFLEIPFFLLDFEQRHYDQNHKDDHDLVSVISNNPIEVCASDGFNKLGKSAFGRLLQSIVRSVAFGLLERRCIIHPTQTPFKTLGGSLR